MENKNVTLTLTLEKVNIILSGLGELPSKVSYDIINEIHNQVRSQLPEIQPTKVQPTKEEVQKG